MPDWEQIIREHLPLPPMKGLREDRIIGELADHMEDLYQRLLTEGRSPELAREMVLDELGEWNQVAADLLKEEHRHVRSRTGELVERADQAARCRGGAGALAADLLQDLRHGVRRLLRRPGFTVVAVIMMTLAIGANTTIFSLIQKIVLEPLPYDDPEQLVRVFKRNDIRGWLYSSFDEPGYIDYRDRNTAFTGFGAYTHSNAVMTGTGEPLQLEVGRISTTLFSLLGIEPALGRAFSSEEDADGLETGTALLTHDFWVSRFGEDPGVIGRSIILDDRSHTVIGVLPDGENWLSWYDVYVPLCADPGGRRGNNILWTFGRLKEGVSIDEARTSLDGLASILAEEYPETNEMTGVTLMPLNEYFISGGDRTTLWALFGAVGFVLLIACANLANMLLARATGRRREIAVSAALGAGRGRIVRQLLTESVLLTVLGGVLGLLFAFWLLGILKLLDPGSIPRLETVTINGWVALFTAATTITVGIVAGSISALQLRHGKVSEALKEGGRSTGSRRQHRARTALIVTEMALSVTLLIGAGLMIRSFDALRSEERGFETDQRILFDITLPESTYQMNDPTSGFSTLTVFLEEFTRRLESMPTITRAGAISAAPLEGLNTNMGIYAVGDPPEPGEDTPLADWRYTNPGYFEAMGIPLLQGRTWLDLSPGEGVPSADFENNQFVINIVISESCARELWPNEDPIGRECTLWSEENTIGRVIGVVGDMRERGLESDPREAVYLSWALGLWNPVTFILHTTIEPESVVSSVRSVLSGIDNDLPVSNIRTLDDLLSRSMAERRFTTFLLISFALVALILALSGIYGVMSFTVAERIPEIAVRMTLGSKPGWIVRLLAGEGMRQVLAGTAIGLAAAIGLSRTIRNLLYGVNAFDPATWLLVAFLLIATAFVSIVIPALRATRIDPIEALREE